MKQREIRTYLNNSLVQLIKPSDENIYKVYKVLNISRGGICFESNENDFELNEIIKLNLLLNKQSIHMASGRVCYCNISSDENLAQFGLSFLDNFIDADILRVNIC